MPQQLAGGHLKDVQQVGQGHGLAVKVPGHLLLDAPDDAQVVLLHLVDIPGDGQGQGGEALVGVLGLQALIELIGAGHDGLDVLGVLFQKVKLGLQVGGHEKQVLIALLVLLPEDEQAIAAADEQNGQRGQRAAKGQPQQGHQHIPGQGQAAAGQHQIYQVRRPVAHQHRQPQPGIGGRAPVRQQQAQQRVIAQIEHSAGIFHLQGLDQRHPGEQIGEGAEEHHEQPRDQAGLGPVAVPHDQNEQHGVEDDRGGHTKALRPHGDIQLTGQGDAQPHQQPPLKGGQPQGGEHAGIHQGAVSFPKQFQIDTSIIENFIRLRKRKRAFLR